ncbi:hypothetical protein [Nigerium massiliense]|nr:hypothetical protein [Nigerium massiliense]
MAVVTNLNSPALRRALLGSQRVPRPAEARPETRAAAASAQPAAS